MCEADPRNVKGEGEGEWSSLALCARDLDGGGLNALERFERRLGGLQLIALFGVL